MRSKQITINERTIVVKEKRVKELAELLEVMMEKADKVITADKPSDLKSMVVEAIGDKGLIIVFPELTQDDIENAYPSELEELIAAFIEVNFMGLKKVAAPLWTMVTAATKK